jgi:hypothetical protein
LSACLASTKPWIQTPVLPKKKRKLKRCSMLLNWKTQICEDANYPQINASIQSHPDQASYECDKLNLSSNKKGKLAKIEKENTKGIVVWLLSVPHMYWTLVPRVVMLRGGGTVKRWS